LKILKVPRSVSNAAIGLKFSVPNAVLLTLQISNSAVKLLAKDGAFIPEAEPSDLSLDEKLTKISEYLPKGLTEKILSKKEIIA